MTISELIERLEALKAEHGDQDVYIGEVAGLANVDSLAFDPEYGIVIEMN